MARAMDLDERISYDGADFSTIPDGVWPFTVKAVSIVNYKGGKNIPPCNAARVTLRVGYGADMTDVSDNIYLYVDDNGNSNWNIAAFYRAIGYKRHGEEVQMNWSPEFLVGKRGWCETEQTEGREKDVVFMNVRRYIDPEDAPADGMPIIKGQAAHPVQQAPVQQPVQYAQQPVQYAPAVQQVAQPYQGGGGSWSGL